MKTRDSQSSDVIIIGGGATGSRDCPRLCPAQAARDFG